MKSSRADNWILGRVPRLLGAGAVDLYAALVSPILTALFGPACRFEPSCSRYAREAIKRHGLARGAAMAARRITRCHPLGGHGFDPVPLKSSPLKLQLPSEGSVGCNEESGSWQRRRAAARADTAR